MANDPIAVPYNHDLKLLERLLAGVRRAGDFFVHGSLETLMPRVEVHGVGVLSFPVTPSQIEDLIKGADHAPYGRGGETILDTSVRKAWQLAPARVRIGGKSWEKAFQQIVSTVTAGLGCAGMNVSADLYKLLVYEEGGFFLSIQPRRTFLRRAEGRRRSTNPGAAAGWGAGGMRGAFGHRAYRGVGGSRAEFRSPHWRIPRCSRNS